MECKKEEYGNLIKFLPIEQQDKILFVESMERIPKENQSYDWIFVIPYEEKEKSAPNLKRLLSMLTEKGRLYLLVDNPFSLHRISGEAEADGSFLKAFLPRGFEESKGMSLAFLNKQVKEALKDREHEYSIKLYYPYPNIQIPFSVYTDEYQPKSGECDENFYNFEHARFCFFDEMMAVDEVVKAGVYSWFAGGYFMEIAKEHTNILYCRYSIERDKQKQICTSIIKNQKGEKIVQKAAFEEAANEHIRQLIDWETKLLKQLEDVTFLNKPFRVNKIIDKKNINGKEQVSFSFVEGKSLENCLDDYLQRGEFENCKDMLLAFCNVIKQLKGQIPFEKTEEFTQVFGAVEFKEEQTKTLMALPVTDIDMVCQNVFIGQDITLIDYEWTFAFPIPIDYLIYRVLFCYLEQKNRRKAEHFQNEFDFYKEMGILPEQKKLYEQMEIQFQKYAQGDCKLLKDRYLEMGKPAVLMSSLKEQLKKAEENSVMIQYDTGSGFLEENSFKRIPKQEENGIVSLVLDLPEDTHVKGVKIKFGEEHTMVRIGLLQEDETGSLEVSYETNGISINPILYLYKEKPCLFIRGLLPQVKRLYVSLQIKQLPESFILETERSLCDMREIIANREEQISNYENSKSWKLTKPLRMFGEKK